MILKGFRSVALLSPPLSSRIRPEKWVLDPEFSSLENKAELPLGKDRPEGTHLELARKTAGLCHFLEKRHQTGCIEVDLGHSQFYAGSSRCPGDAVPLGVKPLECVGQVLKGYRGGFRGFGVEGDRSVQALDLRIDGQFRAPHVRAAQSLPEVRVGPLDMNGSPRFHPDPDEVAVLILGMHEEVATGHPLVKLRGDLGEDPHQFLSNGREVVSRGGLYMPDHDGARGGVELEPLPRDGSQAMGYLTRDVSDFNPPHTPLVVEHSLSLAIEELRDRKTRNAVRIGKARPPVTR